MVWKMKLSEDEDRSWKLNRVIISYKGRVSLIALEMFICVYLTVRRIKMSFAIVHNIMMRALQYR